MRARTANALLICFAMPGCLVFIPGSPEQATQAVTSKADGPVDDSKADESKVDEPKVNEPVGDPEPKWIGEPISLFDGKTLDGWETISFGGEGDCSTEYGVLSLDAGDPFTGISSTSENLPKTNFELSLDARKTDGIDFFCGLTFPVAESHCTLIVGGWAGATVGLSCIDDKDASSNDTTTLMKFEKNQWYKIRVRVEPENISAWIDDEKIISRNIVGKKISLRGDTELYEPLGICSFMTDAEYKNIQLRKFEPIEKAAVQSEVPSEK